MLINSDYSIRGCVRKFQMHRRMAVDHCDILVIGNGARGNLRREVGSS